MNFETTKILGGIGGILMFIGIIPFFAYSSVISIIGAVLVLVALHGLAGYFKEQGIFSNALYAFIAAIVGIVIVIALVFTVLLANIVDFLQVIYPGWNGTDWAALQTMTPDPNAFTSGTFDPTTLFSLVVDFIAIWIVIWVFAIIATFLLRRSLKTVSAKSAVGLFGTAGLLMLIGGFLTVIGIGIVLIWIGALLLAIAFFQLKPVEPVVAAQTVPVAPPPPTTV